MTKKRIARPDGRVPGQIHPKPFGASQAPLPDQLIAVIAAGQVVISGVGVAVVAVVVAGPAVTGQVVVFKVEAEEIEIFMRERLQRGRVQIRMEVVLQLVRLHVFLVPVRVDRNLSDRLIREVFVVVQVRNGTARVVVRVARPGAVRPVDLVGTCNGFL